MPDLTSPLSHPFDVFTSGDETDLDHDRDTLQELEATIPPVAIGQLSTKDLPPNWETELATTLTTRGDQVHCGELNYTVLTTSALLQHLSWAKNLAEMMRAKASQLLNHEMLLNLDENVDSLYNANYLNPRTGYPRHADRIGHATAVLCGTDHVHGARLSTWPTGTHTPPVHVNSHRGTLAIVRRGVVHEVIKEESDQPRITIPLVLHAAGISPLKEGTARAELDKRLY